MVGPTPSREYVIDIGPVSMPAHGGHGDVEQPSPLALELPVDGWLRGLAFELVDENGKQLPRRMLHHLNLIVPDRRELFSQIMLRIGAAGPETKPYVLPWFLGYRVRPGDSLTLELTVLEQRVSDSRPSACYDSVERSEGNGAG